MSDANLGTAPSIAVAMPDRKLMQPKTAPLDVLVARNYDSLQDWPGGT